MSSKVELCYKFESSKREDSEKAEIENMKRSPNNVVAKAARKLCNEILNQKGEFIVYRRKQFQTFLL